MPLVCYILSLILIYIIWEPEGFFGFVGAALVAIPFTFLLTMIFLGIMTWLLSRGKSST